MLICLIGAKQSYAAESYPGESFFEKFSDTDKVVRLPNGGFLHGKANIYNSSDPSKIVEKYDSSTDPNAISIGQLKEKLRSRGTTLYTNLDAQVKSANVPTQIAELPYGGEYVSDPFSGSGWRFGGYLFKAITSPLPYLIWSSHVDSGLVGTKSQATYTHNNGSQSIYQGNFVGVGARVSLDGTRCFYTLSPINGTYYYVGNVDG